LRAFSARLHEFRLIAVYEIWHAKALPGNIRSSIIARIFSAERCGLFDPQGATAPMMHFHDPVLVGLSVLIAIFASFTALHLAARLRDLQDRVRIVWLGAASIALGGGIWAMHFVAMLAFSLPSVTITYDPIITFISLVLPIVVTGFGFVVVARKSDGFALLFSGIVMGFGIVAMHYSGMAAIRFNGTLHHQHGWVLISVLIAVGAATAALWLAFQKTTLPQRFLAAIIMGFAISGMHYSAMAGALFTLASPDGSSGETTLGQTALALWVALTAILILLLGLGAAIADRRFAEQRQRQGAALQESEQRFRLLVQGVTDYALYMLDRDGRVTNWNLGAQRIKGYTADEVVGSHFSRFYTEEDRATGAPQRALAAAESTGRVESEGWRVRKDGSLFWANAIIDAIRNDRHELIGFAKITRDITESKEAREVLEKTKQALAQSQKMEAIGQLTGGVAHDFNNLLMVVLGNLDIAKAALDREDINRERLRRAVENALHGAQRASSLTKSLLAFSRQQPLQPRIIDVNQAIKDVAPLLQRALGENRPLEIVGAAGAWNAEADPVQLEASLLNLVINARDAMPEGGKVTLECANVYVDERYATQHPDIKPGQFIVLSVSDTGSGMSPEILSRAFEPFFTTKASGHGTGLGLSQVFGFVKQSGGHVNIYSELGQGTTVKMYFPRAYREPDKVIQETPAEIIRGNAEHILIAEDDADVRKFVLECLRDLNYQAVAVESAEAALDYIQSNKPVDALVTDVIMPGINGRKLADIIKSVSPKTKVIFMTGYSRNAIVHHGRLDPGVVLLQKPFSREELSNRLRSLLKS
jgi:PAS domain S-box-containing protein